MSRINFVVSDNDREHIKVIADRMVSIAANAGHVLDHLETCMDIIACHNHGCPLDLARLADADDFNIVHDVGGIAKHLNRKNGQLLNCFRPRFAAPISRS